LVKKLSYLSISSVDPAFFTRRGPKDGGLGDCFNNPTLGVQDDAQVGVHGFPHFYRPVMRNMYQNLISYNNENKGVCGAFAYSLYMANTYTCNRM
jgi:hypothetical protein